MNVIFDSPVPIVIRSEQGKLVVRISTVEDGLGLALRELAQIRSHHGTTGQRLWWHTVLSLIQAQGLNHAQSVANARRALVELAVFAANCDCPVDIAGPSAGPGGHRKT
jgi:hypothetical protein